MALAAALGGGGGMAGMAGGGGGGGMPLLGAAAGAVGGLVSGVAGLWDSGNSKAVNRLKKSVRRGVDLGEMEASAGVGAIRGTPQYQAYMNTLNSLYGLPAQGGGAQGLDNPYTVGANWYLGDHGSADPQGLRKSMRGGTGSMAGDYANIAKADSLQRAASEGATLSAGEQKFVAKYTDEEYLKDIYGRTNAMTEQERLALGVRLQDKGLGAQDWQRARAATAGAAGERPAMESGGNGTANPYGYNPMEQQFQTSLQLAQSQRGLYNSNVGAAAEASGMAAYRQNLQLQYLPQLMGAAEYDVNKQYALEQATLQKNVYRQSGGQAAYGQPLTPLEQAPSWAERGSGVVGDIFAGIQTGAAGGIAAQNADTSQRYYDAVAGYYNRGGKPA